MEKGEGVRKYNIVGRKVNLFGYWKFAQDSFPNQETTNKMQVNAVHDKMKID
jgi:hypothetical protein